jgi:O-antigen ligase
MGCIFAGGIAIFILGNLDTILADVLNQETGGRLSIWTLIIEKVMEDRAWLGYGYNAFWSSDAGTFLIQNTWTEVKNATEFNAHSSYVEMFAGLGIFGISVYAISLITTLFRAIMLVITTKKIEFFWLIEFLVFAHIAGISNVGKIVSGASSYWVLYVSICLSTAVEYRRLRNNQKKPLNTREIDRRYIHGKFQN